MKTLSLAVLALTAMLFASPVATLAGEEAAETPAAQAVEAQAPETADAEAAVMPGETQAAGEEEADPATVLATVNGAEINLMLFNKVMEQVPAMPDGVDVSKDVLDKIVDLELIAQEAVKAGIDTDPGFVVGMEMYKKQQLFALYLEKTIVETVKVEPEEVSEYYEQNKAEFETSEQVRASHILVDTEEKALEVKAKLDAGEKFEDLAKTESSCPSSSRGGDLGFFGRGSMVPEFEDAAFALKEGDISAPVKTQFGYHIITLTGRKLAGTKPLEEARPAIEQMLLEKKQRAAYEELLAALRKDASITVNMDVLEKAR